MTSVPPSPLVIRQPATLGFGCGCLAQCPGYAAGRGWKSVLIVGSRSSEAAVRSLSESLGHAGVATTCLIGVPAEPDVASFEAFRARSTGHSIDAVIGFGGGSVLDIAKLVAALHGRSESVRGYFGSGLLPERTVGLVCIPTTAGAGSEVSPNAILYDEDERLKKAVISPHLIPDAAFVDSDLTVSMPAALTASTGLDALVHCIEAYANRFAHPFVDVYALAGIRLISAHLPSAVRNPGDRAARAAVSQGSLYGGLCLGPVNTAAVHALAYPLGSEFRMAHGLSNALLLPHVIRFNLEAAPDRYAAIARALGSKNEGASDLELASECADRLAALCAECGLPRGLASLGVPREAVGPLATAALKVTRLLKNNPRTVTEADARSIYLQAF